MKNHRRKRRKKGKALQSHEKETLSEAPELNPLKEEVREMKPSNLEFNLICADHYSLYERTSVREETRKKSTNTRLVSGNGRKETKRVLKGEPKSVLPPLKERTQRRKQLTFAGKRRACEHSILNAEPVEERSVTENSRNITLTCSESQKKLASLSFVGIYDLDDMGKAETNEDEKLESILKSGKQRDKFGISSEEIAERVEESSERTERYVIQTLTLEGQSPFRRTTLFQDKLLLPGIKQNALSTRPHKTFHDKFKTSKRQQRLLREGDNRLPNIVQSVNRTTRISPRSYRGKLRKRDNSFNQVYLEGKIPRLPIIVNGRMSHS